jgi:hypothetical protein
MTNKIKEHHNNEEIQYLNMESDVALWRDKLEFVADEIAFYLLLLGSSLIEKTNSNNIDANYLLKEFNDLKDINERHMDTGRHFQNSLEGMAECDDVQCDNAYLHSYLLFKSTLEKHLFKVRNIKQSAFQYLKIGIEKYAN